MPETIPQEPKRKRLRRNRRRGARRSLWTSRLTRNIFLSNLIGLIILVTGALAMNRFEVGLINAKVDNLKSLASTITTVIGCLLYTSPSPRDGLLSRMPSSA